MKHVTVLSKKQAPKIFRDKIPDAFSLTASGVWVWVMPGGFVRVGSGGNIVAGMSKEREKHKTELKDHKAWILQAGVSKENRKEVRQAWINFFYGIAPAGKVLNPAIGKGPLFKLDPKSQELVSNLEAMISLRNPAKRVYRVHGSKLGKFFGLPERKGSFYTVLDKLQAKDWYIMGLSYFNKKNTPPDEWKEFVKDKETIKALKLQKKAKS